MPQVTLGADIKFPWRNTCSGPDLKNSQAHFQQTQVHNKTLKKISHPEQESENTTESDLQKHKTLEFSTAEYKIIMLNMTREICTSVFMLDMAEKFLNKAVSSLFASVCVFICL